MSSKDKNFFAGLEEIFARLLGLALTLIFFLIYIVAAEELVLGWQQGLIVLGIFWIVYETVSLVLFSVFRFFAKQKNDEDQPVNRNTAQEQIENDYAPLPESNEPDNNNS